MIIKLNKNLSFSNNSRPLIIAEISGIIVAKEIISSTLYLQKNR